MTDYILPALDDELMEAVADLFAAQDAMHRRIANKRLAKQAARYRYMEMSQGETDNDDL